MFYIILLLVVGIILVMMEILLPSGGLLGILSTGAIVGALVLAFREGTGVGFVFLGIAAVLAPAVIIIGFKIFPHTPVGRKMILKPEVETVAQRGSDGISGENCLHLLNAVGRTVTPLRPSGIAEINGQRYSVITEGQLVDKDTNVVVVCVEGNSIVVEQQSVVIS